MNYVGSRTRVMVKDRVSHKVGSCMWIIHGYEYQTERNSLLGNIIGIRSYEAFRGAAYKLHTTA